MALNNYSEFKKESYQLLSRAAFSVENKCREIVVKEEKTIHMMIGSPYSSYIPILEKEVLTPDFHIMIEEFKQLFGKPSEGAPEEVKKGLRKVFLFCVKTVSGEHWGCDFNGHFKRVGKISRTIAHETGIDEKELDQFYWAGLLHDVGKIFVGGFDHTTYGKSLNLEREIVMPLVRTHASLGATLLNAVFPLFEKAGLFAKEHQENFMGTGYPKGLTIKQMSLEGKFGFLADRYDAFITRIGWVNKEMALNLLDSELGHYNDQTLKVFRRVVEKNHNAFFPEIFYNSLLGMEKIFHLAVTLPQIFTNVFCPRHLVTENVSVC